MPALAIAGAAHSSTYGGPKPRSWRSCSSGTTGARHEGALELTSSSANFLKTVGFGISSGGRYGMGSSMGGSGTFGRPIRNRPRLWAWRRLRRNGRHGGLLPSMVPNHSSVDLFLRPSVNDSDHRNASFLGRSDGPVSAPFCRRRRAVQGLQTRLNGHEVFLAIVEGPRREQGFCSVSSDFTNLYFSEPFITSISGANASICASSLHLNS